jgi:hypothetical protein
VKYCDQIEQDAILKECGRELDNAATYLKLAHEHVLAAARFAAPCRPGAGGRQMTRWASKISNLQMSIGGQAKFWDKEDGK